MNSSSMVQSSGVPTTQRNTFATLASPNAQDSTSLLVRLEEKYGSKRLRIDSRHANPPRSHIRAEKFKKYTDWLSNHVNNPDGDEPRRANDRPHSSPDQVTVTRQPNNITYADPGILATVDPLLLTNSIDTSESISAILPSTNVVDSPIDLSIPVDDSGLSFEKLNRVDDAHSTRSLVGPTQSPLALTSWDVTDFSWPSIIDKIERAGTQTADYLADAAIQILGTSNHRLAVIGSGRGPGTTTIAMYLSRILASKKQRVLLIDADLSKPDLTRKLSLPTELSWFNAIHGKQRICHSIIRSGHTGICVMPVQKLAMQVSWPRFVFDRLGEIVDRVQSNFDFILIDVGPSSQIIRELSKPDLLVDAAMLVHNARLPDHSMFVRNQNELNSFGIKRLVVAENFSTGTPGN